MFCDMIDQIIDFNKSFVEQKGYEKYLTDKYPDKKLAVLSCMDTRLQVSRQETGGTVLYGHPINRTAPCGARSEEW